MDPIRRKILKAGAVATAMAATPRVFTQQAEPGGAGMSVYERGPVRITYEESGSGFPLLLIAGRLCFLTSVFKPCEHIARVSWKNA